MAQLRAIDPNKKHPRELAKQAIAEFRVDHHINAREGQRHQYWLPLDLKRVCDVKHEEQRSAEPPLATFFFALGIVVLALLGILGLVAGAF